VVTRAFAAGSLAVRAATAAGNAADSAGAGERFAYNLGHLSGAGIVANAFRPHVGGAGGGPAVRGAGCPRVADADTNAA
jgi:hypothetical protein